MLAICGIGAVGAVAVLVFALRAGREPPVHPWAWIAALVVIGVPATFLIAVSVGAVIAGGGLGGLWMVLGTIALWSLFAVSVIRPRWGAWVAIVSAIVLPDLLALATQLLADPKEMFIDVPMMIGFYSVRTLIAGGLLVWASMKSRSVADVQVRPTPRHSARHA